MHISAKAVKTQQKLALKILFKNSTEVLDS